MSVGPCGDMWQLGLINGSHKYLTAETFGFKINANGISLKKKQTWRLEPAGVVGASGAEEVILLKSHLGKYLAVDSFGNVTCDIDEPDATAAFEMAYERGKCTLKNVSRGYYLSATADKLTCTAPKATTASELWTLHLAARPQVTLKSVGRKRYAHLAEGEEEIYVDANVPWGADTLFTLEFREDSGTYGVHSSAGGYLGREGKLQTTWSQETQFSIEYHNGQMAMRDLRGLYLAPIGSKAVLKTRSHTVTKDELFILEDSLPQAAFVAALNSRYVSTKQGVDVTANQEEISNCETFQLEFEEGSKSWYIRTMQDKYWSLSPSAGVQANCEGRTPSGLFTLEWLEDGSVSFKSVSNGKYVGAKRSGHLYANYDAPEESSKFFFYLINRPILVLKCDQGYVGCNRSRLECNKANYETIRVERDVNGLVLFRGPTPSTYWTVSGSEVTMDSEKSGATKFYLELREPTRIAIKTQDGTYLNSEKNGAFAASNADKNTLWEF